MSGSSPALLWFDRRDFQHDLIWVKADYLSKDEKLNDVQTTIAVFYIGNERLMTTESFGDSCLRQSCLLSLLGQQLNKSPMAVRMQGFGHPLVEQISLRRCGNPNFILSKNWISFYSHPYRSGSDVMLDRGSVWQHRVAAPPRYMGSR